MANEIDEIKKSGEELEKILNQGDIKPSTKNLIKKAIKFGYVVGQCETKYDLLGDPYSSSNCIEKYEGIKKILRNWK
jgi:hypothetical protein